MEPLKSLKDLGHPDWPTAMSAEFNLRESDAWDKRYELPLFPNFNNPWIYMAYADLALRLNKSPGIDRAKVVAHFQGCEAAAKNRLPNERGMFARWPTGSDQTSHDEIMGAAHFHQDIARWILRYLDENGGNFNQTGEPSKYPMRFNVYRMPYLRPYLVARAGFTPNPVEMAIWNAHLLWSAFTDRGENNAGGRLRNWLMIAEMERFPICQPAIWFWRWRMAKRPMERLNYSLFIEPGSNGSGSTVLAALAPEEWLTPPRLPW